MSCVEPMEHIRNAVERAKGPLAADTFAQPDVQRAQFQPHAGATGAAPSWGNEVTLNSKRLESKRIIAHDIVDPRSKSFDILRTQVLQSMNIKPWQILGVTSPTADCGKTVIAINLAISIARQPGRAVLLVDMDLQKPRVANYLGLRCELGLMSVLERRANLSSALTQARIRNEQFLVLPCEASTLSSSEWMVSRSMSTVLQDIRRDYSGWTVIVDLPPILPSDDVISILPQIDSVLFVAAAGTSTVAEIKACNKHLESTSVVRVVVNKAEDADARYYSYSPYGNHPASRMSTNRTNDRHPYRSGRRRGSASKWM